MAVKLLLITVAHDANKVCVLKVHEASMKCNASVASKEIIAVT